MGGGERKESVFSFKNENWPPGGAEDAKREDWIYAVWFFWPVWTVLGGHAWVGSGYSGGGMGKFKLR